MYHETHTATSGNVLKIWWKVSESNRFLRIFSPPLNHQTSSPSVIRRGVQLALIPDDDAKIHASGIIDNNVDKSVGSAMCVDSVHIGYLVVLQLLLNLAGRVGFEPTVEY